LRPTCLEACPEACQGKLLVYLTGLPSFRLESPRQDVRFFNKGQDATIRLKRSKSDYDHRGVTVVVTASHDSICPIAALQSLMERDPQPESAPLFRLSSGAFTRDAVLRELETRLLRVGIPPDGYRGHSFRKGAAQKAHNNGLTQKDSSIWYIH
jgi:hypothetical protein